MVIRTLEKLLVLITIALLVVIFVQNLVGNPALLDWVVPIIAGIGFVVWLIFKAPHEQY